MRGNVCEGRSSVVVHARDYSSKQRMLRVVRLRIDVRANAEAEEGGD